jgi:hypothetical protein
MRTERAGKVVDAAISYLKGSLRAAKLEVTANSGMAMASSASTTIEERSLPNGMVYGYRGHPLRKWLNTYGSSCKIRQPHAWYADHPIERDRSIERVCPRKHRQAGEERIPAGRLHTFSLSNDS